MQFKNEDLWRETRLNFEQIRPYIVMNKSWWITETEEMYRTYRQAFKYRTLFGDET